MVEPLDTRFAERQAFGGEGRITAKACQNDGKIPCPGGHGNLCDSSMASESCSGLNAGLGLADDPSGAVRLDDPTVISKSSSTARDLRSKAWSSLRPPLSNSPPKVIALTNADLLAVQHGLEALSAGLVLLDSSGRLMFANHEAKALLDQADAIFTDASKVMRCRDREAQKQFQKLVATAAGDRRAALARHRGTLAIPRESGWPLAALVTHHPVEPSAVTIDDRVVVLMRDPKRELCDGAHWLTILFGLSGAEAAVVARLAGGTSLEDIAVQRKVTIATVRNQLKSALSKIGVNRQAELVSIVVRSIQF